MSALLTRITRQVSRTFDLNIVIITIITIFNITHFYSIVNCEFYYSYVATVMQKERGKRPLPISSIIASIS